MSLEQALADNTAALNKLITMMEKSGTVAAPTAEKPKADVPKADVPKADVPKTDVLALTYQDVRTPFLALVEKDQKAAMGVLTDLGIKTLKEYEGKPEKFADILALVNMAMAKLSGG